MLNRFFGAGRCGKLTRNMLFSSNRRFGLDTYRGSRTLKITLKGGLRGKEGSCLHDEKMKFKKLQAHLGAKQLKIGKFGHPWSRPLLPTRGS